MNVPLHYSAEVQQAKSQGRAIVALESTIITHGMPYPQNVETARLVENDVRKEGATPATIAVINGVIHVGLEGDELEALGQAKNVMKVSRADLPACVALGRMGATTVAATMIVAHMAGISTFATGGIGGVHRGAELSFDISADLLEFAKTPVIVVAAGPKAILDIPKTLETLETQGVPVISYGQDDVPAFWSRSSGLLAPLRMDAPKDIAKSQFIREKMGVAGGSLVVNPIPAENEIPKDSLAPIIEQALREADENGILAKDVTPFLLSKIFELTEGRSLTANIALVRNNARVAAQIALAFQRLQNA
ncbi:MAG: pseudouridine-5'-phosphate glycosidase [Halocynthiibacter sp.]